MPGKLSKAAAKRELDELLLSVKPWEQFTPAQEQRIEELKAIAYPAGLTLPRSL